MDVLVYLISTVEDYKVVHFNNFEVEVQVISVVQTVVYDSLKVEVDTNLLLQIEIYH